MTNITIVVLIGIALFVVSSINFDTNNKSGQINNFYCFSNNIFYNLVIMMVLFKLCTPKFFL